ncbi:TPA: hypothetical protein ACGXP3_002976 [Bacillus cereus]|uniref:hypothetical protein n=1 Tax=Bacillus cereus group TaxID=86661 RepID=UPI0009758D55|nr:MULTISPECIES: hypothetical protein [Bacillus cereus group]MDA2192293.1 hypothetical protein [Bacillus cereus group sp. Bc238]MDA2197366.1 hypothetical protein [Bacillus cereus group sp. Bc237]MDA2377100.1 hypothetical protein [Bacillus cereus]ONG74279.1 hypothetical protein BKK44_07160 [Bacillus cereus]
MWYSIFFDKSGVFQWAGVAAIVSFLAFVSTVISLVVTWIQGKKTRKSTTLVNLRIQELKEIREEGAALISTIRVFLNERNVRINPDNKVILETDPIVNKLDAHFNKLYSKLYRQTLHGGDLSIQISTNQILLYMLKETDQLVEIQINISQALDTYSRVEYMEIENSI